MCLVRVMQEQWNSELQKTRRKQETSGGNHKETLIETLRGSVLPNATSNDSKLFNTTPLAFLSAQAILVRSSAFIMSKPPHLIHNKVFDHGVVFWVARICVLQSKCGKSPRKPQGHLGTGMALIHNTTARAEDQSVMASLQALLQLHCLGDLEQAPRPGESKRGLINNEA
mmetsp:Transcript_66112/g.167554  ORF Transcript_66112/g.167554 Transcript_66112/m.167554 type:complete len:170 (-) Transcript_66112:157-666(-)